MTEAARASGALGGAHREIGALAQRRRWSENARALASELVTATAEGTTGPREIAQRYRAIARGLDRASRARLWQVVRRVARTGLRTNLDAVYRNEL